MTKYLTLIYKVSIINQIHKTKHSKVHHMALEASSIIVPSVQELIKQPITKIPERYFHSNQDTIVVSNKTSLPQVPIIDLHKLLSDDTAELEKLDQACREWGFFQVN